MAGQQRSVRRRVAPKKVQESALGTPPGAASRPRSRAQKQPRKSGTASKPRRETRSRTARFQVAHTGRDLESEAGNENTVQENVQADSDEVLDGSGDIPSNARSSPGLRREQVGSARCEAETVRTLDNNRVEITIKRIWETAVHCPCENEECKVLVRVGKYGHLGTGQSACPHCGLGRTKTTWKSKAELMNHVHSEACKASQGIKIVKNPPKKVLGKRIAYEVNHLDNFFEEGPSKRPKFRCPKCNAVTNYQDRYKHCIKCYPKHGVQLST